LKMDEYCKDMWESLDGEEQLWKMFRNWQETREQKKIGPSGDVMLQEKLKVKYVGLKLDKNEGERRIFTVHAVQFMWEHRKKYYRIVVVTIEFDTTIHVDKNDDAHHDFWGFCQDTYDCFRAYYDLYANEDHVMVYEKGGVCDRERKEEEGEEV
jgi:hypothetical protein